MCFATENPPFRPELKRSRKVKNRCARRFVGASSLGCSLRIVTTVAVSQELAALQKMQEMERTLERVEALAQDEVGSSSCPPAGTARALAALGKRWATSLLIIRARPQS